MLRKGGCLQQPEVAERVSSETNNTGARLDDLWVRVPVAFLTLKVRFYVRSASGSGDWKSVDSV